ncbi:MAG: ATP-binding protein [Aestuariibaculum sp.]
MDTNVQDLISEIDEYAIFSLDLNGNIESWNLGATKIKGYSEEEVIGKHFEMFYTEEDRKNKLPEKLLETAKVEKRAINEGWRLRKNGDKFWGSVVITAIHLGNKVIGFSKITRDLTHKKLLMDEIMEAKQKAEESNKLKLAFLATMNHELRTPLNHIIEFSQFISESDNIDSDILEYSEIINKSGKNLLAIIEDIFNIALLKNDKIKINYDAFIVGDLYDEVLGLSHELLSKYEKNSTIKLKAEIDTNLSTKKIISDKYKIVQVVKNLIDNAIKFTNEGFITIKISQPNEKEIAIAIQDTGIGIPKEKQEAIFDYFVQVESPLTRSHEGIGIGLSIANLIATTIGGNIILKSKLDKGTAFIFNFPIQIE